MKLINVCNVRLRGNNRSRGKKEMEANDEKIL